MNQSDVFYLPVKYTGDALASGDLILQKFLNQHRDPETVYVYSTVLRRFYDFENSFLLLNDEQVPRIASREYKAYSYHEPEMVDYMIEYDATFASEVDEFGVPKVMVRPCNDYRILNTVYHTMDFIQNYTKRELTISTSVCRHWTRVSVTGAEREIQIQQLNCTGAVDKIGLEYMALALYLDAVATEPTHFADSIRW